VTLPPWPVPPPCSIAPGAGETLDRLAGDWWIFQLARGNRYTTDDVLTAWFAARAVPAARRILDLGAGVGSVGLLALLAIGPPAKLTCVEVQPESVALLDKTIAFNALGEHVRAIAGDLRDGTLEGRFDLVTANPPYLPPGSATEPRHAQERSARIELHGDVFEYARAAARLLADEGRFVFCHAASDARPEAAIAEAGLFLERKRLVAFRADREPMLALHIVRRDPCEAVEEPLLVVREADHSRSHAFVAVRRALFIDA
jgi:tRNA1Val (adenine37-N6)-methyltransferase